MRNSEELEQIHKLHMSASAFIGMCPDGKFDKGLIVTLAKEAGLIGEGRGFHFPKLMNAVCGYFREKLEKASADTTNDKARRLKAEADTAELRAITRSEYLREVGEEVWAERMVAVRTEIERAPFLPAEHKTQLVKLLSAIQYEREEDGDGEEDIDPAFL